MAHTVPQRSTQHNKRRCAVKLRPARWRTLLKWGIRERDALDGGQTALLVPTEVLAEQHFATVIDLLDTAAAPLTDWPRSGYAPCRSTRSGRHGFGPSETRSPVGLFGSLADRHADCELAVIPCRMLGHGSRMALLIRAAIVVIVAGLVA